MAIWMELMKVQKGMNMSEFENQNGLVNYNGNRKASYEKQFGLVDFEKFFFACCVVAYHVQPWKCVDGLVALVINAISNLGVVFFFIISGFLIGVRSQEDKFKKRIKHQIFRILKLWIIWEIIYFPFVFWGGGQKKHLFMTIVSNIILGSYAHLWYLRATVVGLIVIYLLWNNEKKYIIYITMIVSLSIGLYGLNIYKYGTCLEIDYINNISNMFRNGIFFGFPCLMIGMIISKIKLHNNGTLHIVAIFIFILYVLEFEKYKSQLSLCLILFVVCLVLMAVNINIKFKCNSVFMRHMSTLIYFIHYGVYCIVSHFNRKFIKINELKQYAIVMLTTILLALLILKIGEKVKCIKMLY